MTKKELVYEIIKFYEIDESELMKLNKKSLFLMLRVMECYKYKEVLDKMGLKVLNTASIYDNEDYINDSLSEFGV